MSVPARPTLDEDEREDAKQVIALAVAGVQRERAATDAYYLRGRNVVAFTAALFTAVQSVFVASVGRGTPDNALLLTHAERIEVLMPAAVAGFFLVGALSLLLFVLDRPRAINAIGEETLTTAWLKPTPHEQEQAVLSVLAIRAIQEEAGWAAANKGRADAAKWIAIVAGLAAVASFIELGVLYVNLTA